MGLQSRAILFVAIGALLAMMGGFVFYASLDNPSLEQATVELVNVEVIDVNSIENRAKLQISFLVANPSEKTFTVPIIAYELFADGKRIGTGQYSTEDVAMPGRAAFYPGSEIPLKNIFILKNLPETSNEYQKIVSGENVTFSAEGTITVETAWSIIEKDFETTM